MEINHDKCKIIVNREGITPMIYMYDKQIENVEYFKYLGAMLTNSGNSKNEIRIILSISAVSALVKLYKIWRSGEIEFKLKFRLCNSLILSTLLYGSETLTLIEESKKNIRSFESKAQWNLLNIAIKK